MAVFSGGLRCVVLCGSVWWSIILCGGVLTYEMGVVVMVVPGMLCLSQFLMDLVANIF